MAGASKPPLGQHFLRDPHVVDTILAAADLRKDDTVLEIGPGRGALTEPLISRVHRVVAVELDTGLAERLRLRWASSTGVQIHQGDFLQVRWAGLFPDPPPRASLKLLGNLPYAVTSPILEKILAWPGWKTGVFLVQREVGQRILSAPGSRAYGILSLAVQVFAEAEKILLVKPGAFSPPPRVTSMVIRLRRREAPALPEALLPDFFDLAHAAFAHRRKTLANSLALFTGIPKKVVIQWLRAQEIEDGLRAENISLQKYQNLAPKWSVFRREKKFDKFSGNVYNSGRS